MSELEFNVPFQHKHGYIRDEEAWGGSLVSSSSGVGAGPRPPAIFFRILYTNLAKKQVGEVIYYSYGDRNGAVCQCRDKSGTPSQKRDKWASLENCDLFPGHVVKIRDCHILRSVVLLGKFGSTQAHNGRTVGTDIGLQTDRLLAPSPTYCASRGRLPK